MDDLSLPAVDSLRRAQNAIIEHSLDRISAEHPWYRTLPEAPRRQIEAVARLGVTMFVDSVETIDVGDERLTELISRFRSDGTSALVLCASSESILDALPVDGVLVVDQPVRSIR